MLRTFRSLLRFQRIVRTLARHDALAPLEEIAVAPGLVWLARRFSRRAAVGRPGETLARALTEMGPSFTKLGQVLTTRWALLGQQVAFDLPDVQAHLPPFDSARARVLLGVSFGNPVDALFASLDPVPENG